MMKHLLAVVIVSSGLALGIAAVVQAQDAPQPAYGRDLMTEQEWLQHRDKMRSLQTQEERLAYRKQIHEQMKKRAQEKGLQLPDEPPKWGPGMGMGPGGGMGQGKGMMAPGMGGGRGRQ